MTNSAAAESWMRIAMGTAVAAELQAPAASRLYTAAAIAMSDAYAAAAGETPYAVRMSAPTVVDRGDAALVVHYAASSFLSHVYPQLDAFYRMKLVGFIGGGAEDKRSEAKALGDEIARMVFDRCFYAVEKFPKSERLPELKVGRWRPTESYYFSGLEPEWPSRQPFELDRADQFRQAGPPEMRSKDYALALAEVETLGRQVGGSRTAEETQIARFWEDGMQTSTPPGHWNAIALQEIAGLPLGRQLDILLTLNIAMADAGIAAWDTKYHYRFWRPVTAIREAAADGNPATLPDDRWFPYFESPMHPDYVSGHSTFSVAAATVLTHYLGAYPITIGTESMVGDVRRSFASFDAAAKEAGRSRVYGGIHFEFSNRDGQKLGKDVADRIIRQVDLRNAKSGN